MTLPKPRLSPERIHDDRTALVKEMVAKESAALDAKTARLKALRLARDAAEPASPPNPKRKKKTR